MNVIGRLLMQHFFLRKASWVYKFENLTPDVRQTLHKQMLQRLFMLFPCLPVDPEKAATYVLQIGYNSSRSRDGEIHKQWYLHPQSIGYILSGLLEYVVNPQNVNLQNLDDVSDPVARIVEVDNLMYVRVLPLNQATRERSTFVAVQAAQSEPLLHYASFFELEIMQVLGGLFGDQRANFTYLEIGQYLGDHKAELMRDKTQPIKRLREVLERLIQEDIRRLMAPQPEILQNYFLPNNQQQGQAGRQGRRHDNHNAGFFPYFNLTPIDLTKYQIAHDKNDYLEHKEAYQMNCTVYALQQSGYFTENEIHQMSLLCNRRMVPVRKLTELCAAFDFKLELRKSSNQQGNHKSYMYEIGPKTASKTIQLGLVKEHVFLNEKIDVTSFYIKHFREVEEWVKTHNGRFSEQRFMAKRFDAKGDLVLADATRKLSTFDLVRTMVTEYQAEVPNPPLHPVMMSDVISLDLALYREIDENDRDYLGDLCYKDSLNLKSFASCSMYAPSAISNYARDNVKFVYGLNSKTPIKGVRLFYADFEAFTVNDDRVSLDKHEPFMCCVAIDDPEDDEVYVFSGNDCGRELLDFIQQKMEYKYHSEAPVIYFHNLGYDINFLAKYGIYSSMPRGRRMLNTEIDYDGRIFTLKDSASLIPMPLKAFGPMFGLDVEKEIFPYEFYTRSRYFDRVEVPVMEVIDFQGEEWDIETQKQFLANVRKIIGEGAENIEIDDLKFNLKDYAAFYCKKDVEVLKKGLNAFREGIKKDFGLEATNYLSVSSVADAIFNKAVYSKTKDLYKVGGIVREFMQKAIHGGRVMCADNQKWAYRIDDASAKAGEGIVDFDAVSLYPSAMSRLWVVSGKPEVFTPEQLCDDIVGNQKYTAYVVDILITKIGKPRHFPLVIDKSPETGSVLNTNEAPVEMTVCDIELEDLIKFQRIEFIPLRGYYWTGEKSYKIQECIRNIFQKRYEYKQQHNPLEGIYKLIMNSIYGKTILKPAYTKLSYYYKTDPAFEKLVYRHSGEIDYITQIDGSNIVAVKRSKPILKHFNFSLFGIHILAMSKRIMNEVMCLAEDLGMQIYYQDTDSMHIERHNLDRLAREYKIQYGRDLIGRNLGQFHSDFDLKPESENVRAVESYFIGKKCYLDRLIDDQGNTGYHIRLKGVPKESILDLAEREFKGDVTAIYKRLAVGHNLKFDLLAGNKVRFDYTRSMTVRTKDKFERNVSFTSTLPPANYENGAFCYRFEDGTELEDYVRKPT